MPSKEEVDEAIEHLIEANIPTKSKRILMELIHQGMEYKSSMRNPPQNIMEEKLPHIPMDGMRDVDVKNFPPCFDIIDYNK